MTEYTEFIKKNQTLPEYVHSAFKSVIDTDERDVLVRGLRQAGWTLESIANAANITRERVRQISNTPSEEKTPTIEIPTPPVKVNPPKRTYIEPHPDTLARLLELQPYAQQVRANGSRYRAEAEEYTRLIHHAHTVEGVTLYRLAKRLGVTHGALRFRLVRYGYKKPVTATSKVYTPIIKENRA